MFQWVNHCSESVCLYINLYIPVLTLMITHPVSEYKKKSIFHLKLTFRKELVISLNARSGNLHFNRNQSCLSLIRFKVQYKKNICLKIIFTATYDHCLSS
jgi:hypothetical protein